MTFDILYSLKGDAYISRHLKTVATETAALAFCRKLSNLPVGTIHYAITCDDGRTIHDTRHDGILRHSF